jgi:diguanylate cyclase (GGDEF)-like protein
VAGPFGRGEAVAGRHRARAQFDLRSGARPIHPTWTPTGSHPYLARGRLDASTPEAQLRLFLRWLVPLALFFAVAEAVVGVVFADRPSLATSLLLAAFAVIVTWLWLRIERLPIGLIAGAIGSMLLVVLVATVVMQPTATVVVVATCLVCIVVALPYLGGRGLWRLMLATWLAALLAVVAGEVLPDTSTVPQWILALLRVSATGSGFGLVLLLLWQFSTRLKETARELGSLVEMSRDLSEAGDAQLVGDRIAQHLAEAVGFEECAISHWDLAGDRVVTFGYWPAAGRQGLAESYALTDYPETRRVLVEQVPSIISRNDPDADPAELDYLRQMGFSISVMLPLVAKGTTVGLVELTSRQRTSFDRERLELARSLAGEAAIGLENARLNDELRRQAFEDGLTGLANRALFQDRLEHALARGARQRTGLVAVLFIDMDDFKLVNDRLGHARGDALLRAVADRLRAGLRPADTAARLGGDEFAVLLEDLPTEADAIVVAERLVAAFREPIEHDRLPVAVSCSIGVASTATGAISGDELVRNADLAMYRAKSIGKGGYEVFQPSLRDGVSERAELAARLRGAADRGELQLHYQPIVTLDRPAIVGVEALVRWQLAGRDLLYPDAFIALAEETGLIVPVGRWVIREACRQAREWQQLLDADELGISVNLSAREFQQPDVVEVVRSALADSGLEPNTLTLEITESVLMLDTPATVAKLAELRALGVRLAIDDFGTGYSSLGYLERFPIDILKIDRAFVDGLTPQDRPVLAQAIVQLARTLRLGSVAEGIERPEQLEALRALGCERGQGYLFSRPRDAASIEALLRAGLGTEWSPQTGWGEEAPARPPLRSVPPPTSLDTRRAG